MKLIKLEPLKRIKVLRPYVAARSILKGKGYLYFDANENSVPLINSKQCRGINRYPDPTADKLRLAISGYYDLKQEQVLIGNGSDELIDLLIKTYVRQGRRVLSFAPTYGMYRARSEANNIGYKSIPLAFGFKPDWGLLKKNAEQGDVLILCNPNNPTGSVIPLNEIKRFAFGFSGLVIVDEAYGEFADAQGFLSGISLVKAQMNNVAVLRTFSKAFGAAGLRLGYVAAPKGVVDSLLKVKYPYNVNSLSQNLGLKLWQRRRHMEQVVKQTLAEKKFLQAGLAKLGCKILPSLANYFLLEPPSNFIARQIYNQLKERNKIVTRIFLDEASLTTMLRITVGSRKENLKLLRAFSGILPIN